MGQNNLSHFVQSMEHIRVVVVFGAATTLHALSTSYILCLYTFHIGETRVWTAQVFYVLYVEIGQAKLPELSNLFLDKWAHFKCSESWGRQSENGCRGLLGITQKVR